MAVRHLFAAVAPARALAAVPGDLEAPRSESLVQSYRQLADVFHDILSEQSLDNLLDRIADTLAELVPHDTLSIYQADEAQTLLIPVLARDKWAEKIMESRSQFGEGITGWAALHREPVRTNEAHNDPRTKTVPGTPDDEPEALITVPLIARDVVKGVLNIYRLGEHASFSDEEFELTSRFADAAALALDNAQIRARLEYQAQTDSLTGLYNHRYFHDRLRAELTRASRARDCVAVLMLDIDDFKRVNDVYGHGAGDQVLTELADLLRAALRGSDVVCRLGGEEFGVIMAGGDAGDALNLARRLTDTLAEFEFGPAGKMTISVGISEGPQHAMNPRELVACSEAAMMTAKARGKNQIVLFDEHSTERPDGVPAAGRDVRSIAHLKMLQSLAGKLNRLNDVRQIGAVIADELRLLIDYHNCRVSVIEGDEIVPIAFRGELVSRDGEHVDLPRTKIGEGITGRAAATAEPQLVGNTLECDYAVMIPGTHTIEESLVAVPLCYGTRVIGVIVMSKLGVDQFDREDVRLLEVLAGHASVALENARLYESQRREADHLKALLEFTRRDLAGRDAGRDRARDGAGRLAHARRQGLRALAAARERRLPDRGPLGLRQRSRASSRCSTWCFPAEAVRAIVGERVEPFLLGAGDAKRHAPSIPWPDLALAPLWNDAFIEGFIGVREPIGGEHTLEEVLRLLAGISHQAAVALERARSFENLEDTFVSTVEALANALEANDEYTSSHTRWITDMALKVGAEARLRPTCAEAARARGALPRHRQDRDPDEHPAEARPAHRRGAKDHRDASRARRADPRADRPPRRGSHDRAQLPRALGRRRLPGQEDGRGHPGRGQDRARLRRVPRDDDRPALPQEADSSTRPTAVCARAPAASSTRLWSRSFSAFRARPRAGRARGRRAARFLEGWRNSARRRGAMVVPRQGRRERSYLEGRTPPRASAAGGTVGISSALQNPSNRARVSLEGRSAVSDGNRVRPVIRTSGVSLPTRSLLVACALVGALGIVAPASASQLIARNASNIKLAVNSRGTAMVTYSVRGKVTHLLAWGAVNARHRPGASKISQIHFKLDYSGGWKHRKLVWKRFQDACQPYDGPELAWFVAGCKASNGSYWALQSWQTRLPGSRHGAVARTAEDLVASPFPLDRRAREARRLHRLGLQRPLPGGLRPLHLPRGRRPRLRDDRVRQPHGQVRPPPLPRHVQLFLRPRLDARELVRLARAARDVLLRLLPA